MALLLQNGADIEHETLIGTTSVYMATYAGNESAVKMLIETGANVNHRSVFDDGAKIQMFQLSIV